MAWQSMRQCNTGIIWWSSRFFSLLNVEMWKVRVPVSNLQLLFEKSTFDTSVISHQCNVTMKSTATVHCDQKEVQQLLPSWWGQTFCCLSLFWNPKFVLKHSSLSLFRVQLYHSTEIKEFSTNCKVLRVWVIVSGPVGNHESPWVHKRRAKTIKQDPNYKFQGFSLSTRKLVTCILVCLIF